MVSTAARTALIAGISVEVFLVIVCLVISLAIYLYCRRSPKPKSGRRPWPFVLPLYWYLSFYDGVVDNLFSTEPRLKMVQHSFEPPEKVTPLVELFTELENEIEDLHQSVTDKQRRSSDVTLHYPASVDLRPKNVTPLYDLEQTTRYYQELKELYEDLESDVLKRNGADERVVADLDALGEPDIENQNLTETERPNKINKTAIMLKEIEVSLDLMKTESGDASKCENIDESKTVIDIPKASHMDLSGDRKHVLRHKASVKGSGKKKCQRNSMYKSENKSSRKHYKGGRKRRVYPGNKDIKHFIKTDILHCNFRDSPMSSVSNICETDPELRRLRRIYRDTVKHKRKV